MQVRYRYRLYSHPPRQAALARAFGCAPVVWNDALALSQDLYKRGENYLGRYRTSEALYHPGQASP